MEQLASRPISMEPDVRVLVPLKGKWSKALPCCPVSWEGPPQRVGAKGKELRTHGFPTADINTEYEVFPDSVVSLTGRCSPLGFGGLPLSLWGSLDNQSERSLLRETGKLQSLGVTEKDWSEGKRGS